MNNSYNLKQKNDEKTKKRFKEAEENLRKMQKTIAPFTKRHESKKEQIIEEWHETASIYLPAKSSTESI